MSDSSRCKLRIFDVGHYTLWMKPRFCPRRALLQLTNFSRPVAFSTQTKSPTRCFRIGLGEKMGILYHDFFSIPMLLNSSELISEMSKFAPARATNTSKQIETARTNIGHTPFFIYLFNRVRVIKLYPLTVLIFTDL